MMAKNHSNESKQLEVLTIEQLVPKDHLFRELDATIDKEQGLYSVFSGYRCL